MGQSSGFGLIALFMHGLPSKDRLVLGRCSTQLGRVLATQSAWKHCPVVFYALTSLSRKPAHKLSVDATRYMPVRLLFTIFDQDAWFQRLHEFATHACIVSMTFHDQGPGVECNERVSAFLQSPCCRWLAELRNVSSAPDIIQSISKLPRLHTLALRDKCELSPSSVEVLRCAPSGIKSLTYSDYLEPAESSLLSVATLPSLTDLTVKNSTVSSIVAFCQAIAPTAQLKRLAVKHIWPDDPNNDEIVPVIGDVGVIHTLAVEYCDVTCDSLLTAFSRTSSLRQVYLFDSPHPSVLSEVESLLASNPHMHVTLSFYVCMRFHLWDDDTCHLWSGLRHRFPDRTRGP
jgi:hypothetical protein